MRTESENKRRFPRYRSEEPIFASLTHFQGSLCRVRDIGGGGLGIECTEFEEPASGEHAPRPYLVNIFFPEANEGVFSIPYEIVHTTPVAPETPSRRANESTRIGLRFLELSSEQRKTLETVFRDHCTPAST